MEEKIKNVFEALARDGDAGYAIAYALLMVSESLDRIGSGPRPYSDGALERIANEFSNFVYKAEEAVKRF
jgi:hypothetical protein